MTASGAIEAVMRFAGTAEVLVNNAGSTGNAALMAFTRASRTTSSAATTASTSAG